MSKYLILLLSGLLCLGVGCQSRVPAPSGDQTALPSVSTPEGTSTVFAGTGGLTNYAAIPAMDQWLTLSDAASGFSLRYPAGFFSGNGAPDSDKPSITVTPGDCSVTESTFLKRSSPRQFTGTKIVNDVLYHVFSESEGAAGSIYTTSDYLGSMNDKCVKVEWTMREVTSCSVYGSQTDQDACTNYQSKIIPAVLNQIVSTFIVTPRAK